MQLVCHCLTLSETTEKLHSYPLFILQNLSTGFHLRFHLFAVKWAWNSFSKSLFEPAMEKHCLNIPQLQKKKPEESTFMNNACSDHPSDPPRRLYHFLNSAAVRLRISAPGTALSSSKWTPERKQPDLYSQKADTEDVQALSSAVS